MCSVETSKPYGLCTERTLARRTDNVYDFLYGSRANISRWGPDRDFALTAHGLQLDVYQNYRIQPHRCL